MAAYVQRDLQYLCTLIIDPLIIKFIISYPWWFLSFAVLLGLLYASILYLRNRRSKLSKSWSVLLFVLRFISIATLAFLLLSPFILSKIKHLQKPLIIFGQDNSGSIVLNADSSYLKGTFLSELDSLKIMLSDEYDIESYTFGNTITYEQPPDFTEEASNYASFLSYINDNYAGLNVGALIVSGDGIYNKGIDPVFMSTSLDFPIYTIALGDSSRTKNLKISDIRYNSIAYLNDKIPLEVTLNAAQLKGKTARIRLSAFGSSWGNESFKVSDDRESKSFTFQLQPSRTGKQRISITIETDDPDELTYDNQESVFIDILDNRQRILILANAPHPDIGAIKASLESNEQYVIELKYAHEATPQLKAYDLVILHQLPSVKHKIPAFLDDLEKSKLAVLYILGAKSDLTSAAKEVNGIVFHTATKTFGEAQLNYNPLFSPFKLDESLVHELEKLPPLIVPLENQSTKMGLDVLAFQKINQINTQFPLISFYSGTERKEGVISGEGLWIWRMHNYLRTGDHSAFDRLIGKTIQYLLARTDRRPFRVHAKGIYESANPVGIHAEFYNPNHEPISGADIAFVLTNESGENFNYQFSSAGTTYNLNLGRLDAGVYTYNATTTYDYKNYQQKGEFIVKYTALERKINTANHGMLFRLAHEQGGEMIFPAELDKIPTLLKQQKSIKSLVYYEELFTSLHKSALILSLIILLLSMEWFLRKYLGSY